MPSIEWQPYREPLRNTILRNGAIAVIGGAVIASWRGGLANWPLTTLLMLLPSFGGHTMEIFFLNWLRFRLPSARGVQVFARLEMWFVFGVALWAAVSQILMAVTGLPLLHRPGWWFAGLVFIGVEFIAHLALQLRGWPSFYNGRG